MLKIAFNEGNNLKVIWKSFTSYLYQWKVRMESNTIKQSNDE